jgi:predicted TIM-barrel fold metal-dependent hydrolase
MVADQNPVEHLVETYSLMFPGKSVTPLMFTTIVPDQKLDEANDYVARASRENKFPALIFSHPRWNSGELTRKIKAGGFLGAKSYLSLAPAYLPAKEIRIFDFFPRHQLEVLNKHGLVMMLHIPRDGRLRDPVNLAQMLEIEERYPNIKLIIAHVGRAYCPEDIGDSFKVLAKTRKMCFDCSANTNAETFRQLLETVGPKRVLFGSDMPILRMRTRRICENGFYVNIVPRGIYGDISGDKHMREVNGQEAERLTFFMYEELDAFRRAAHAVKLSAREVEDIFYNNARQLLAKK